MRTETLTKLLVISVAFNIAFTVGFLYTGYRMRLAHSPQGRMDRWAKKLDLTDEQAERFKQRRQSIGAKRQAFLAELIKDEPDQKLLESFALEKLALKQESIRELSPEQKQKFIERMNKRVSLRRKTDTGPPAE
jgi:Spy/CpxP family protein refolding chaperone